MPSDRPRECRVDGDIRIGGCPECDLIVEVEGLEEDLATAIGDCRDPAAYTKGMEAAAKAVRDACVACEASGIDEHDEECQYCGRPMAAIRAAAKEQADA